jgi:acetoin:2,6-dichlorophenolindophenol oxidoreductase subunit beta
VCPGTDVTVVAFSRLALVALKAAEQLGKDGISVEVIDGRSRSPVDEGTILESVNRTHRLVVVDEDTPRCSMASDVVSLVARKALFAPHSAPQMVTPPHTPVPYSPPMEDFYIPSVQRVGEAVRATLEGCV